MFFGNPVHQPGRYQAMRHTGYCIAGNLVVRMIDTGSETHIRPGDFFEIPPGHDAYVDGTDRVELILFAPPDYQH